MMKLFQSEFGFPLQTSHTYSTPELNVTGNRQLFFILLIQLLGYIGSGGM